MSSSDKGFYLRLPPDVRAELDQAHWDTRENRDEILLQGFAIWLHAQRRGSLAKILDRIGYLPKHHPDRAKAGAGAIVMEGAQAYAEANGQPAGEPEKDDWDLDEKAVP